MGDAYWAAREGDILLHTSIWADIAGAAVEIAFFAVTSIGPGGVVASIAIGVLMHVSGADSLISDAADYVSSLFPLSEEGKITTGSHNTYINGKPAARAAGMLEPQTSEQPEQPTDFIDVAAGMLVGLWDAAKQTAQQIVRPTVAAPDQPVIPKDDDKIICDKHPHPPGTYEYMAEGSSKVYINGQPAVRSNDRSTCEAKVTDNCEGGVRVSNNVRIGGEPVVVREIKSGKHPIGLMATAIIMVLKPKKICNQFVCFALTNAAISYVSAQITAAVTRGNPVHLPTGAKLLA
ncbi:MAG: PAAR domain-containing protein, partial [Snodgrassella sp.]